MYIFITALILSLIVLSVFIFASSITKDNTSESSNSIINQFEPDNAAPTLTEMINSHKNKEIIKYEI